MGDESVYGAVLQICEDGYTILNVYLSPIGIEDRSDNNSEMLEKNGILELGKITTIQELGKFLEDLRGDIPARQIAKGTKGICTPVHLRDLERGLKAPSEKAEVKRIL